MLETAFQKIEQLVDKLLEKNASLTDIIATLKEENEQLSAKLSQLNDESETLQLESLEQEEKQSELLVKVNALLGRIEEV
ncbi:MAG: DUF904 domain-containing protein [Oceanospirillaceae bacterium]|nr:DUF904 domain-containing protein [Oceanospirillaceae bacterium]